MKKSKYLVLLDIPLFLVNYIYLIICAKILMPTEFGVLNSYLSVLSVVFVIGITLQMKVSSVVDGKVSLSHFIVYVLSSAFLSIIICLSLGCDLFTSLVLMSISVLHPFISLCRGLFIRNEQLLSYYKSIYIEMFFKLFAVIVLYLISYYTMEIMLLTLIVGQVSSAVYCLFAVDLRNLSSSQKIIQLNKDELNLFLNQFSFFIFINLDIFLVNKFYMELSGITVLAIRFAQIPLLLAVTFVQFDIKKIVKSSSHFKLLKRYAPALSILFLATFLFLDFLGPYMIPLLFGESYLESLTYIPHFLIYFFLASLIYIQSLASSFNNKYLDNTFLLLFSAIVFAVYYLNQNRMSEVLHLEKVSMLIYFVIVIVFLNLFNLSKGVINGQKI